MKLAKWNISWGDGYYPYCSNCAYEPPWEKGRQLYNLTKCPNCYSTMINCNEFHGSISYEQLVTICYKNCSECAYKKECVTFTINMGNAPYFYKKYNTMRKRLFEL